MADARYTPHSNHLFMNFVEHSVGPQTPERFLAIIHRYLGRMHRLCPGLGYGSHGSNMFRKSWLSLFVIVSSGGGNTCFKVGVVQMTFKYGF